MNFNYHEISDRAYTLHQKGKIKEAEDLYLHLLDINPDDVNVLNLYGLLCLQTNKIKEAIKLLSKAVILNESPYILTNLAKAYYMDENYKKAIILYNKVATIEPNDDVFYSMALAYKKANNFEKAINTYEKALSFNPKNTSVMYNLSILYKDLGNIDSAIKYSLKAELTNENDEDIQTLLAGLYESQNDYKQSIIHLEKAFKINPNNVYLYNMAVLSTKLKQTDNAILLYKQIINNDSMSVESYINLAHIYKKIDIKQSLVYAEKAYQIRSNEKNVCLTYAQLLKDTLDNQKSIEILNQYSLIHKSPEVYSLLAINYMDLLEYDTALSYYKLAIELSPNNLNYLHGKAMALKYLGRTEEARILMEYIVKNKNASLQSKTTLGMMYLQEKHFQKGMELYIKRSDDTKFKQLYPNKNWVKGTDLSDKVVLVYSDCGLGDTIMFSRYLPKLCEISKKVILQTDKELIKILTNSFKNIEVKRKSVLIKDYDVVIPIMSLPYALNIDFDNIPTPNKYLYSKEEEQQEKLQDNSNLKVGIFYQGNKKVFKNRSIPINIFKEIFEINNITYYSFQLKDDDELDDSVIKLKSKINDYNDTANYLKQLDILVSVDSSIAHMAGSLGVKTILLLPYTAEWRWFNDTKTTPWYKSIRIIKQASPDDWSSVITTLKEELQNESRK